MLGKFILLVLIFVTALCVFKAQEFKVSLDKQQNIAVAPANISSNKEEKPIIIYKEE